jgi:hypothetical protein
MKLPLALGIAAAALTVAAASAQSVSRHVVVHGGHGDVNIDANEDGWITRAEASSGFERIFAGLDTNDDGRLDAQDHREFRVRADGPDVEILEGDDDGEHRVRVITRTGEVDERVEREIERAMEHAGQAMERAEREVERAERHAERAERHAERAARHAEEDGDREVVIIRRGGGTWVHESGEVTAIPPVPPVPAVAPVPPHAPMFMMLIANSEEADTNGDGALSLEEFRAQHLRFFDASDANGDGRVRFERPVPPEPPTPPTPPEPPRRR